jgi:hypothetical protein
MKNRILHRSLVMFAVLVSQVTAQNDFDLEDLNPNSETYGDTIGPADYLGDICIVFFGHES